MSYQIWDVLVGTLTTRTQTELPRAMIYYILLLSLSTRACTQSLIFPYSADHCPLLASLCFWNNKQTRLSKSSSFLSRAVTLCSRAVNLRSDVWLRSRAGRRDRASGDSDRLRLRQRQEEIAVLLLRVLRPLCAVLWLLRSSSDDSSNWFPFPALTRGEAIEESM